MTNLVRKEKLGDRITVLQQLVSPFGTTDNASVLHETIEYIKFLHGQVDVLSTPYMKQAAASIQQLRSGSPEGKKPISATFPVANETAVDFWTPTFGGNFRYRE
ncbi:putative Minor allergen Alt a [Hibiscus syriacus]|uniref:Minor allergen Alt a n=1 Tax=Hibiscus syriacus TaxID=106335 RepID=A0A6A3AS21_HIBSY|nr:putative Minor allergen Alt a [Hibiscus syriacus]